MAKFGERSRNRLETVHPLLVLLFEEVVKDFDCTVLTGHRDEANQNECYRLGKSKLKWPESKHNTLPSRAIDVCCWPIDWTDISRHYYFSGYVLGTASRLSIPVRFGGDWDSDRLIKDQDFNDLVHFELCEV